MVAKSKRLIENSDYRWGTSETPIRYASNNSKSKTWDYVMKHNCEWQAVFEYACDNKKASQFAVDVFCVALGDNRIPDINNDIVFYGNKTSENNGIQTMIDIIGGASYPDEVYWIDFTKIDNNIIRIEFLLCIYMAEEKGLDFTSLTKLRVRVEGDKESVFGHIPIDIFQYDIDEIPCTCSVIKIGSLLRDPYGWSYNTTVEGYNMGLVEVLEAYGFNPSVCSE